MPDESSQIGQVSVGVVAKGVEETNKQLDSVAQHAREAQAAVGGVGGNSAYQRYVSSSIQQGTPFNKIMNEERFAASGSPAASSVKSIGNAAQEAAPKIAQANESAKSLLQSWTGWERILIRVGAPLALVLNYIHQQRVAALEAAAQLSKLTEAWTSYIEVLKSPDVDSVEGKLRTINERLEKQKDDIDEKGTKQRWSSKRIREEQQRAEEQAQEARDAVKADYEKRMLDKKAAEETAAYERIAKRRQELEDQAALAGMEGAQKILEEGRIAVGKLEEEKAKFADKATQDELDAAIAATKKITEARGAIQAEEDQKKQEADQKRAAQELEREKEKAYQVSQIYVDAANQSRASILAAFNTGTSGLLAEAIAKFAVIAEGIGRQN